MSRSENAQHERAFISYARQDFEDAKRLYDALRTRTDLKPWLDKQDLLGGQNWDLEIREAIKNSRYFIALFSSTSVSKTGYVQKEFRRAIDTFDEFPEGEIFAIPVRLDDCEIPYERFKKIERVDLFPDWDEGIKRLLRTFQGHFHVEKSLSDYMGKHRKPVSTLIEIMAKELLRKVDKLDAEDDIDLDRNLFDTWYRSCFDDAYVYCGTDISIPSKFVDRLKAIFEEHIKLQEKHKKNTSRILIVDEVDIVYDFQVNYSKFVDCCSKHKDNNISLYQVDTLTAIDCAKDNNLPANAIEIGIWGDKYAIQCNPSNGKRKSFSFGYMDSGQNCYSRCVSCYDSLMRSSKKINVYQSKNAEGQEVTKLIFVPTDSSQPQTGYEWRKPIKTALDDPKLVPIWRDFVNCEKRLKETGRFLSEILESNNCVKILDARPGVGCETVYLADQGQYRVTANESSRELKEIAQKRALKKLIPKNRIRWTSYDWRVMAFEFSMREFDAVLVLGNFISLIYEDNDRTRCLDQFFKILKPGGVLIIDLRNYGKISANSSAVGANAEQFYKSYKGDFIYCGDQVKGWPYKINGNTVTFRYARNTGSECAELLLYMLQRDDLLRLLADEGFINIQEYSDFKSGFSKDADFFIYVAKKPLSSEIDSKE